MVPTIATTPSASLLFAMLFLSAASLANHFALALIELLTSYFHLLMLMSLVDALPITNNSALATL